MATIKSLENEGANAQYCRNLFFPAESRMCSITCPVIRTPEWQRTQHIAACNIPDCVQYRIFSQADPHKILVGGVIK